MRNIVLIVVVLIVSACSGSFTGPVTGTKYDVDMGCTDDMQKYREDREEVIGDKSKESQPVGGDCFAPEKEKTGSD